MDIREARPEDAEQISLFLRELTAAGKRTRPDDEAYVRAYYIGDPDKISCLVAIDGDEVLGLQSLKRAEPGNEWDLAPGWGIIGTHIRLSAARRGVGRRLFAVTRQKAEDAGLVSIDASIGETNVEGLAYYEAIGFRSYRTGDGVIGKRYDVAGAGA